VLGLLSGVLGVPGAGVALGRLSAILGWLSLGRDSLGKDSAGAEGVWFKNPPLPPGARTSLTAASNTLPQSLLLPNAALADWRRSLANSWAPRLSAQKLQASLLSQCDIGCQRTAARPQQDQDHPWQ